MQTLRLAIGASLLNHLWTMVYRLRDEISSHRPSMSMPRRQAGDAPFVGIVQDQVLNDSRSQLEASS